jgi:predicted flap endonuclease-1-like 5' DNA nuclease
VPYTLTKTWLWWLLALALGMLIGYLLWGRRKRTVTSSTAVDTDVQRLRDRVSNLEPAVAERDRLRVELDECRAAAKSAAAAAAPVQSLAAVPAGVAQDDHDAVVAERDRLAGLVGEHESTIGDLRARNWNAEARADELQGLLDARSAATAEPPAPDVSGAAAVLGKPIKLDDLKVVEGIGPKIEELIHATGVRTWWSLANTDVASLRSMLDAAGPRFQIHEPGTWPQQARLLAHGQWAEFKTLIDSLEGGKPPE